MKALIILNHIQEDANYCNDCGGLDYCNNINPYKICGMQLEIDEAISELEELQQHIKDLESQLSSNPLQLTCETCVEFSIFNASKKEMYYEDGICLHGMSCANRVFKNYGCILHTPKDTKCES